jgi:hypothetical protein
MNTGFLSLLTGSAYGSGRGEFMARCPRCNQQISSLRIMRKSIGLSSDPWRKFTCAGCGTELHPKRGRVYFVNFVSLLAANLTNLSFPGTGFGQKFAIAALLIFGGHLALSPVVLRFDASSGERVAE